MTEEHDEKHPPEKMASRRNWNRESLGHKSEVIPVQRSSLLKSVVVKEITFQESISLNQVIPFPADWL
jgi:hypothetical protein